MNKEMIISSGDHDTRVAILEEDQVVEIFIERERQRGVVGNIYKGRVSKVLPGMQSSFVDIGLERDAFLYVSEVVNTVEEFDRLESGTTKSRISRPYPNRRVTRIQPSRPALNPCPIRRGTAAASNGVHRRARSRGGHPGTTGPSRRSKTSQGRAGVLVQSSRNRSHEGPGSRRTSRCRGGSWCSCRRSITSGSPENRVP